MSEPKAGLIFQQIPKVMAAVGAIEKGRKNQQQNYAFRGIDDVLGAFQKPLAEHGVFYIPEVLEEARDEGQTKAGGTLYYTRLRVAYTFYAADGSSVRAVVVGEAMDSGDKSSNKAMSAALKYAMLQIFCVPVEQDDADAHSPEMTRRATIEPSAPAMAGMSERDQLLAKAKELAEACGAVEVTRQLKAFNAEKISALTDAQLPKLIAGLQIFLQKRK